MKKTYISLLRGINVGGKKKILMNDLQLLYEDLGFTNIKTYIQSGNVIFEHIGELTNEILSQQISQKIADKYGFDVAVFVKTIEEFEAINALNPFLDIQKTVYVTLLNESPSRKNIETLQRMELLPDDYLIFAHVVFWYCIDSSKSKLSNNFFESKLKLTGTTRNWTTISKLAQMAHDIQDF